VASNPSTIIAPPVSLAGPKGPTSSVVLPIAETVCKSIRPSETWSEFEIGVGDEILRPMEVREEKEGRIETMKE